MIVTQIYKQIYKAILYHFQMMTLKTITMTLGGKNRKSLERNF